MKRIAFTIFLSLAVLILLSAYERKPAETIYTPRNIEIPNGDSLIDLNALSGSNKLVTFWSSDDATSRLSNMYYASFARNHDNLVHVGVNFDASDRLFKEILRRDNLAGDSLQFHVNGNEASDLIKRYGLGRGFQSYMIDSSGKIIARNPTDGQIKEILNGNKL